MGFYYINAAAHLRDMISGDSVGQNHWFEDKRGSACLYRSFPSLQLKFSLVLCPTNEVFAADRYVNRYFASVSLSSSSMIPT